ncbi:MAG: UDP-glucose/GDP-mannose dehydrogenase family protein [Candidatus Omnitrophica bacterium]|nr:UDP-glucose/GDP-mannose dehydrogenase family protein [Candidatus Omnitrophota bacterium]
MNISIIGTGYVGLVTGTCFADLGNNVICADSDKEKLQTLKKGKIPIYEPGLEEMFKRNEQKGRLKFTSSIKDAVLKSDIIFICVGTPSKENGEANLLYIEKVSKDIAQNIKSYKLIVEKSTVPVETGERVKEVIRSFKKNKANFDVASNPEFLREGSAVEDFMHPDRIVIGVESKRAKDLLAELYRPLKAPLVVTDIKGAEIIKHASNSFLATKISFINAISNICEKVGADVTKIARGIGLDKRISTSFLNAGIGYGGSCFPKDVNAFIHIADKLGYDFGLLREVKKINEHQKDFLINKIEHMLWNLPDKTIAVLGLSFKPDTDDLRSAPALDIIERLKNAGCIIKVYDPKAMPKAKKILKGVKFCKNAYEAASKSDCLVILTDWNEFKELDFKKIKKKLHQPVIIDGRNIYDPKKMKKMGFRYTGIGRAI